MLNFLNNCNQAFNRLQCHKGINNCHECFEEGFYGGQDDYSCLKGCYYYAIHYGPAFVSEIYHFFTASKILEYIIRHKNILSIASLGGGFGNDFLAAGKYMSDNNLKPKLSYQIWDKENNWQNVINQYSSKIHIIPMDLSSQPTSLNDVDIVFINKLFSTLTNHGVEGAFLHNFSQSIKTLKIGSYIVFADINVNSKGRDKFHNFMLDQRNFSVRGKYFFPLDNAYTGDYTPISDTGIIYDCSSLSLSCDVMTSVRKTIFFYYRKER